MLSGGLPAGLGLAAVAPLGLVAAVAPLGLLPDDPVFFGMLALILLFFFFLFLLVRRTVTAFNEGVDERR